APAFTTFYGLYNHHHSHPSDDWRLPERWLTPPATFDLSTPLNLVTTADITGGNSGSPLLDKDLRLVGLVFDGNIESLPNTYLYTDEAARSIAVDARGILEALDDIYDADRIVLELTTGRLVSSEADADAAGSR
ncbi:MAG: S46 family peptidase, partial [Rhodothermales bacterium]|nr:S46 family peptidase [Rhodothermales bacterium]